MGQTNPAFDLHATADLMKYQIHQAFQGGGDGHLDPGADLVRDMFAKTLSCEVYSMAASGTDHLRQVAAELDAQKQNDVARHAPQAESDPTFKLITDNGNPDGKVVAVIFYESDGMYKKNFAIRIKPPGDYECD